MACIGTLGLKYVRDLDIHFYIFSEIRQMENASFFYCIFLKHQFSEFLLGVKMNSFDIVLLGLMVQRVIQDDALNK